MNEQLKIKKKHNRLSEKLDSIHLEIIQLQDTCTHPNASEKHRGDTGNYDPTADCYWIEYKCPDCDKFWTVDQ